MTLCPQLNMVLMTLFFLVKVAIGNTGTCRSRLRLQHPVHNHASDSITAVEKYHIDINAPD